MLEQPKEFFLEYPDINKILKEAPTLSTAIVRYCNIVKFLKDRVDVNPKWSTEKEKKEAKKLYSYLEKYLDRYYTSYRDIMSREKLDECENKAKESSSSVITPFFKKLPVAISKELPHITFVFSGRFKAFHFFLEKAITIIESRNDVELESYYDFNACKFKVASYSCPDNEHDYATAEDECYEVMNTILYYLIYKLNCKKMKAKEVGPTSDKISPEFREYVKDYIANPKPNGYMALHASFSVELDGKTRFFEVQVVSKHMESMNRKGETSHKNHKKATKIPLEIDYSKIQYPDFEWDIDEQEYPEDDAGLYVPKELTKKKVFRRIV